MTNYLITVGMLLIVSNLTAFITKKNDITFRFIVFILSLIISPIAAYFMVN